MKGRATSRSVLRGLLSTRLLTEDACALVHNCLSQIFFGKLASGQATLSRSKASLPSHYHYLLDICERQWVCNPIESEEAGFFVEAATQSVHGKTASIQDDDYQVCVELAETAKKKYSATTENACGTWVFWLAFWKGVGVLGLGVDRGAVKGTVRIVL